MMIAGVGRTQMAAGLSYSMAGVLVVIVDRDGRVVKGSVSKLLPRAQLWRFDRHRLGNDWSFAVSLKHARTIAQDSEFRPV